MEREQIIKALECCINFKTTADCEGCPSLEHCEESNHWLDEQALALIKELTEENKAWQEQLISQKEKSDKAYYDLACEVEDLRKENERLRAYPTVNVAPIADTVRKMQERLKKELRSGNAIMDKSIADILDKIAKEMLEGL